MGNIKEIKTPLMREPSDYQMTVTLRNMEVTYGSEPVRRLLEYIYFPKARTKRTKKVANNE